jgi:hypothetical protein
MGSQGIEFRRIWLRALIVAALLVYDIALLF